MILILFISIISLFFGLISLFLEIYIFKKAPFLELIENEKPIDTGLTIIIPTYNEELNIVRCLSSLSKIKRPSKRLKIIVVDDTSTDQTFAKAIKIRSELFNNSKELEIISSGERPNDKNWVGKNWACNVGAKRANTEWLLFIDADTVLGKDCIYNALHESYTNKIDLLSLAPKVNCNCLAEWMVQPIITSLLMIGFPISNTNEQNNITAFAAGPFMLFESDSYNYINGHEGTYNEVVEDLALAKKIKENNLKLKFLIAIKDISINMYDDFNSLIEGWSKNWFLGLDKNLSKSIAASVFVLSTYTLPWLLFLFSNIIFITNKSSISASIAFISLLSIIIYGFKRLWLRFEYDLPLKYWYLNSFGGLIVFYIGMLSIYKTYTGNGWTWKGRDLSKLE